jgi:cytochrome c oxidase subunit 3
MARRCSGGGLPRPSQQYSWVRSSMRYDSVYCLRDFFFLRFFWAFFHRSLAVNVELGNQWPPTGVLAFNPFGVPLLNTVILLSSGVSVTWSHHSLICGNHSQTKVSLLLTILIGAYFTALQGVEYIEARFRFADSVYGSTFFSNRLSRLTCFSRYNVFRRVLVPTYKLQV